MGNTKTGPGSPIGGEQASLPGKPNFNKQLLILLALVIVVDLAAGLYWGFYRSASKPPSPGSPSVAPTLIESQPLAATPLLEEEKTDSVSTLAPLKVVVEPESEFEKYARRLEQIVIRKDPAAALQTMVSDMPTNPTVQNYCHSLTHKVGEYALNKYGNDVGKSISYNVDICGGGYVHGIIEYFLERSPDPDRDILRLCSDNSDGTCLHGLGHGIMLIFKMDIPRSVESCKTLPAGSPQVWCAEGVFMENFDAENTSDKNKPYLVPGDPVGICKQYAGGYRDACFYYSGRYILKVKEDPKIALKACSEVASGSDMQSCVRGMAAGIVRLDLLHPGKMEAYCETVPNALNSCFTGAVNYHLLLLQDEARTKTEMCGQFANPSNKSLCLKAVQISPFR